MKKFVVLFLFVVFGNALFAQQYVEVRGKIESDKFKKINLYKVVNGRPDTLSMVIPSKDGSFGFIFNTKESAYYAIGSDYKYFRLYLKPGDKANVVITDSLIKFTGANTKENLALGEWEKIFYKLRKMSIFFLEKGSGTYKEMFPELESVSAKGKKLVSTTKTGNPAFDALFAQTVAFDIDYAALMSIFTPRVVHPAKGQYPVEVTSIKDSKLYDNDDVLKQPYGEKLISTYSMFKVISSNEDSRNFDNFLKTVGGIRAKGELVIKRVATFRSYKEFAEFTDKYEKYTDNADQQERLNNMRLKLMDFKEGSAASDFTYPDSTGKMISLSDFKGKMVLVDVWATWCGPCKKEIPSLMALEEEYHGKDIVFIGVSVDEKKDYQKWKTFLKEHNMVGVQLFAEGWSKIAKDYKIKAIPRFMLFDRNGNIITVDAPKPSNPAMKELIDKQLSK